MESAIRSSSGGDASVSRDWLFGSFFLGGFEASTHRSAEGRRMDLISATQHDRMAAEDYDLCRSLGIRAVREAARWPYIDQNGRLALEEVRKLARLGREKGLIQIWDLMHYGYPDDLDPFAPEFRSRFAAYAKAVATVVSEETSGRVYFTPIMKSPTMRGLPEKSATWRRLQKGAAAN
jgi:hypothetical protein